MRTHPTRFLLLALVVIVTASCQGATPAQPTPRSAEANDTTERTATHWTVAVRSLEEQLADAERQFAAAPTFAHRLRLVALLLETSTRLGRIAALDRIVSLAEEAVAAQPRHAAPRLLRAQAYAAVHRFADALKDLDAARERGALPSEVRTRRAPILMGLGRLDEACPIFTDARKRHANHVNWMLESMCFGKQGHLAAADRGFAQAQAAYRDVSPFIVGWMHFERGAMWDRAGRDDLAEKHYRAAVGVMPLYAHAAGHLAYLAPPREARALLEPVIASSGDPDYIGTLAFVLERQTTGAGAKHLADATRGYAALMQRHPLAFADHAGWFYLAIADDPARALEVAELNVDNRPTPDAYELMIAAQLAAGEINGACETAERALTLKYASRGMLARSARALERCRRNTEAAEARTAVTAFDQRAARL